MFLLFSSFEKHAFNCLLNCQLSFCDLHKYFLNQMMKFDAEKKYIIEKLIIKGDWHINELRKYIQSFISGIEKNVLNGANPIKFFFFKLHSPYESIFISIIILILRRRIRRTINRNDVPRQTNYNQAF
jgi:hypothetical protein